jgi:hypothetical protein
VNTALDIATPLGSVAADAVTIGGHLIQPFHQEKCAVPYDLMSGQHALEVFTAVRGCELELIEPWPGARPITRINRRRSPRSNKPA